MAKASRQQTRQIGNLSLLVPAPRPPASGLASCLRELEQRWQQGGHLAALWQAWPRIAGAQLASHCRPLQLQGGLLTVGAAPGPWLQALQYHRHQLLGALRGAGFTVRDLRVQQHHATAIRRQQPGSRDLGASSQPHRCAWPGRLPRMPAAGAGGRNGPLGPLQLLPARLAGGSVHGDARGPRNGRSSRNACRRWRPHNGRSRTWGRPRSQVPGASAEPIDPTAIDPTALGRGIRELLNNR